MNEFQLIKIRIENYKEYKLYIYNDEKCSIWMSDNIYTYSSFEDAKKAIDNLSK